MKKIMLLAAAGLLTGLAMTAQSAGVDSPEVRDKAAAGQPGPRRAYNEKLKVEVHDEEVEAGSWAYPLDHYSYIPSYDLRDQHTTPSGDYYGIVCSYMSENPVYISKYNEGTFLLCDISAFSYTEFTIEGCPGILDMTYCVFDYWGADGTSKLHKLDLPDKEYRGYIDTECTEGIRHVSYDEDEDGFWVGNWKTLMLIDKDGKTKKESISLPYNISGSAMYKDPEDKSRHLLLLCFDDACVYDYNIESGIIDSTPRFSLMDQMTGLEETWTGGCCSLWLNYLQKHVFLALSQQPGQKPYGVYDIQAKEIMTEFTNDNPAIGLPASGELELRYLDFQAENDPSGNDVVGNVTLKPYYMEGAEKVYGPEVDFTVTVKPWDLFVETKDDITVKPGEEVNLTFSLMINDHIAFESGDLSGLGKIDADGDGHGWVNSKVWFGEGSGHNGSKYCASSASFDMNLGAPLTPDNFLVLYEPYQLSSESYLNFYSCSANKEWPAEHYGVAVSKAIDKSRGDLTVDDFEMVWAETIGDSYSAPVAKDLRRVEPSEWTEHTIDLSKYAGETVYIAFRHFNCSDQYVLNIDDITVGNVLVTTYLGNPWEVYELMWYNDNPAIGLADSGTREFSFVAKNDTDHELEAHISAVGTSHYSYEPWYGYPMNFTITVPSLSGLEEIEADADTDAVYYNISGVQVPATSLTPGIYVRLRGDKADKVIVK